MPNKLVSATKNGSVIESTMARIAFMSELESTLHFAKNALSEDDAAVILAAALIHANYEGIELNDESFKKMASAVGSNGLEKVAQGFMGNLMRGTGDMLGRGADWAKQTWQKGQDVMNKTKDIGQKGLDFAKNLPQNMREKGFQMQDSAYQKQLTDLKGLYAQISNAYKSMKLEMGMLGKMGTDVKKMLSDGKVNPQAIALMQQNVVALKQHLGSLNTLVNQLTKFKNVAAPTPLNAPAQQPRQPATPAAAPAAGPSGAAGIKTLPL